MRKSIFLFLIFFMVFSYSDCYARRRHRRQKAKPKQEKKVENKNFSAEQKEILKDFAVKILKIQNAKKAFTDAVDELKEIEKKQAADMKKNAVIREVDGKKKEQIEQLKRQEIEAKYCIRIAELKREIYKQRKIWLEAQEKFKLID